MGRPRLYDHDEAYARWQRGETFAEIAASYGVTDHAIRYVVKLRQPGGREAINAYHREWQRRHKQRPCIRGCGRLAWHTGDREGVCVVCRGAERHAEAEARVAHGTETRYSWGCRCDLCRKAASAAKRRRREASRVPCSHGCGTLVDGINRHWPDKPPECRPCAMKRIAAERRQRAAA